MTGPATRSIMRSSAAISSVNEVSGSGAATDVTPAACNPRITLPQLEPSAQAPCARMIVRSSLIDIFPFPLSIPRLALLRAVSGDQLIGDVAEIVADDLRLGTHRQHIVPGPADESGLPSGGDCAQRVPGMASDKTKL